ncbi:hypothetical protein LXL04_032408 [Taraxacum kok-saghyz]
MMIRGWNVSMHNVYSERKPVEYINTQKQNGQEPPLAQHNNTRALVRLYKRSSKSNVGSAVKSDIQDIRSSYDGLIAAVAAMTNSIFEFSESLHEMGTCLLEKTTSDVDAESVTYIQNSIILTKNCSKDHICIHCWDLFCKDFYGGKFDGLLRFHEWSKIRNFHERRVSFSAHWDLFCKLFWLTDGLFWIRWPASVWVKGQFSHLIFFWFHVQQRDRFLIKGHNGHFLVNTAIWKQNLIERKWSYLAVKRFMTRSMHNQRLQIVNERIDCIFQSSWLWDLFCKIFWQHGPPNSWTKTDSSFGKQGHLGYFNNLHKWRRGNYLGENVNYVQIFTYIK